MNKNTACQGVEEKKPFDPVEMDRAANEAEQDLENLEDTVVKTMADWFTKHYLKAGHKRLGRILVSISKGG